MAVTHAVIAAAGTSLVLASGDPLVLGLAVVGSQLPDLDTTTSLIGQICYPLSNWIEERYPHRSITHSLLATAFIAVVGGLPLYFFLGESLRSALSLPLGHYSLVSLMPLRNRACSYFSLIPLGQSVSAILIAD